MKISNWLVTRFTKILENKNMNSVTADEFQRLINEWRKNNVKSQIKDIDDEISRLSTMRNELTAWEKKNK